MDNQTFSKIWIVIIALLFIAGGILAWQYFGALKEEVKAPEVKVPAEKVPEEVIEDETASWKTYRIGDFQCGYIGYEIKYPPDLLVKGWEESIERCPAATLHIVSFVKIKDSTRIEVLAIDTKVDPDQLIYKSYEREGAISVKINETEGLKIKEDLFALSKSGNLYLISTENYSEVKDLFNQMLSTFEFLE